MKRLGVPPEEPLAVQQWQSMCAIRVLDAALMDECRPDRCQLSCARARYHTSCVYTTREEDRERGTDGDDRSPARKRGNYVLTSSSSMYVQTIRPLCSC